MVWVTFWFIDVQGFSAMDQNQKNCIDELYCIQNQLASTRNEWSWIVKVSLNCGRNNKQIHLGSIDRFTISPCPAGVDFKMCTVQSPAYTLAMLLHRQKTAFRHLSINNKWLLQNMYFFISLLITLVRHHFHPQRLFILLHMRLFSFTWSHSLFSTVTPAVPAAISTFCQKHFVLLF